jgi:phosphoribosylformylglycinamidine synthase subunit PurL
LNCVQIGEVTAGDRLKYYMDGELVADVPAESLVLGGGAPIYERAYKEPAYFAETKKFNIDSIAEPENLKEVGKFLIGHPNIASKHWVYDQYDSMVGTVNMNTNAPSDAAIVNIKGTNKAIALTIDCNARYIHADPETGCAIAVAEAARNITCSGGDPSAITNCLNFGNPYIPEVYWQFVGAIKGMSKACLKFGTPVTGGNVSFYNQSTIGDKTIPVFPTPTIGMLGILPDKSLKTGMDFKSEGDKIYLIGDSKNDINCSEYLYSFHKVKLSPAPFFDLDTEYDLQQTLRGLIANRLIESAHDCSDGGLFTTLVESAMVKNLGFEITTDEEFRKDAYLFGEAQSRVVVSVKAENEEVFIEMMAQSPLEFTILGEVNAGDFIVDDENWGNVKEYKDIYDNALERHLSN